jgi:signal transduction histidine kinase
MGGSGLGLSIAYWIARAHGGDIQVSSVVGEGTEFRITLPTIREQKESEAGQPALSSVRPVVDAGD